MQDVLNQITVAKHQKQTLGSPVNCVESENEEKMASVLPKGLLPSESSREDIFSHRTVLPAFLSVTGGFW